jgi:hypothetical protein
MIDHNENFDKESHCYFNEDSQEWIPYYQLENYTKPPFRNQEKMKRDLEEWRQRDLEKWGVNGSKEVQQAMIEYYNRDRSKDIEAVEQWGTKSNKEIRAINEIEQPTLF